MLKCGFSEMVITPPIGSSIPGGFSPPAAEGIDDDLFAKACYLTDGETELLIVVTDHVEMYRKDVLPIRENLAGRLNIPLAQVMFCGTHTHSGGPVLTIPGTSTVASPEYLQFVRERCLDAAIMARKRAKPAQIGYALGREENVSFIRRYWMKNGQVKTWPGYSNPDMVKPEGPIDPDVAVIRVDDANGNPLGLISNFACHATAHFSNNFSADYLAGISEVIRKSLGTETVSFFLNGACGNVTHIDWEERVFPKEEMRNPSHYMRIGRIIGYEALRARERIFRYADGVTLRGSCKVVEIERRLPSEEQYREALNVLGSGEGDLVKKYNATLLRDIYENPDRGRPIPADVQVFMIGDIAVAAFPAELFSEFALELKSRAAARKIIVATIANGVIGYVPTPAAITNGGYESMLGWSTICGSDSGSRLIESALSQIDSLSRPQQDIRNDNPADRAGGS
jgi:neutral ceramidase